MNDLKRKDLKLMDVKADELLMLQKKLRMIGDEAVKLKKKY